MIEFHVLRGPHVISYGTCQEEARDRIYTRPGWRVVFERAPEGAMQQPPKPGANWNVETAQWDMPEVTLEQAWAAVRHQRDQRLADSDWVTLRSQEQGTPVPPEWLAYRQALRDITEQADPLNIAWPVAPAA